MKRLSFAAIALISLCLVACERPADVASRNLSFAADNFQVPRRIVFFNGITDKYLMSIEGLCALGNHDQPKELTVTCKTGPSDYKKHFLGLSDNVSYFAEQVIGADVSTYRYRVVFRPETLIPSVGIDTSLN